MIGFFFSRPFVEIDSLLITLNKDCFLLLEELNQGFGVGLRNESSSSYFLH